MLVVSPNFSVSELTRTSFEGDNTPTTEGLYALRAVCTACMEPWRIAAGPLYVTSGWRSKAVNAYVGGSDDSQHMRGEAIDSRPTKTPLTGAWDALVRMVRHGLPVDQAILYVLPEGEGFVHISHTHRYPNRRQLLVCTDHGTRERAYVPWETWRHRADKRLVLPARDKA